MRNKRTPEQAQAPGTKTVTRKCVTCKTPRPPGSLVHGECPDCAGLVPLPLRGERGRFLPGLTPTPGVTGSTASSTRATAGGAA